MKGNKEGKIILNAIPIKINEKYPSKDEIWTFENDGVKKGADRDLVIDYMMDEMRFKFQDSDIIIVLEDKKVIEIIGAVKKIQIDKLLGEKNDERS